MLKMTIGPNMKVVKGELKGIIKSSFIMCAPRQILLGLSYQGECEKRNAYTHWWGVCGTAIAGTLITCTETLAV